MHISLIYSEVMNITLFQAYNEFETISLCVAELIYLTQLLAALAMRFREKHPLLAV